MPDTRDLHILWTNADVLTSRLMVMMYATNAKLNGWWDDVTVVIWGATAKLVAENSVIQEYIAIAKDAGVRFSACEACARELGVVAQIAALDIEIRYWGEPLTELLRRDAKLLTI